MKSRAEATDFSMSDAERLERRLEALVPSVAARGASNSIFVIIAELYVSFMDVYSVRRKKTHFSSVKMHLSERMYKYRP